MKQFLIAVYFFSAVYCYMGLNVLIDSIVEEIFKRHISFTFERPAGWKGAKIYLLMLAVSLVPFLNLIIGVFFNNLSDEKISEIVSVVEVEHWQDLKELEILAEKFREEADGVDKQGCAPSDD